MTGIYKITSPSGRVYVGQTVNLDDRRKDYVAYNCKAQRLLYNSLKKHSFEQHLFEIVIEGEFSIYELNELEIKYVKEFNSFRGWSEKGMNLTTGGDRCERCEESKKMISVSLRKFHAEIGHSDETKKKIATALTGKKLSEETVSKQRVSNKKYWDNAGRPHKDKLRKKKERNSLIRQQKAIRNQQIIVDLKSGIRQDIIAEKYGLSPSAITELKKKHCPEVDNREIKKGENNNFSKLSEQQVKEIKILLKNKTKQQGIADLYNVKLRTIKAIQSGQNWSHIKLEEYGV